MKIAKGMDTVFADAQDEMREFEILFDEDDTLIDEVAGYDENGIPVTGKNAEDILAEMGIGLDESDDPIQDADDEKMREGEVKRPTDNVEGASQDTVAQNLDNVKTEDSIQDADDTKAREGEVKRPTDNVEGKSQDVVGKVSEADGTVDPLTDDDEAARAGEVDQYAVNTEAYTNLDPDAVLNFLESNEAPDVTTKPTEDTKDDKDKEATNESTATLESYIMDFLNEEDVIAANEPKESEKKKIADVYNMPDKKTDDPLDHNCDCDERLGMVKHDTSNVEGQSQETIAKNLDDVKTADPIQDTDDAKMREGNAPRPTNNVEGISQDVIGKVAESGELSRSDLLQFASLGIDKVQEALNSKRDALKKLSENDEASIEGNKDQTSAEVVPDKQVQTADTVNKIPAQPEDAEMKDAGASSVDLANGTVASVDKSIKENPNCVNTVKIESAAPDVTTTPTGEDSATLESYIADFLNEEEEAMSPEDKKAQQEAEKAAKEAEKNNNNNTADTTTSLESYIMDFLNESDDEEEKNEEKEEVKEEEPKNESMTLESYIMDFLNESDDISAAEKEKEIEDEIDAEDIDKINDEKDFGNASTNLEYDYSDEELIDQVIAGK